MGASKSRSDGCFPISLRVLGRKLALRVRDSDSIQIVKAKISEILKIAPESQQLSMRGKVLSNSKTIRSYGIDANTPLILKLRVLGGASKFSLKRPLLWFASLAITVGLIFAYLQLAIPAKPNTWLIATFSYASQTERRMLIRNTWQKYYAADGITFRFILGRSATLADEQIVEAENRTFGDLVVLNNIEDSDSGANSVKPMYFYKR